MESSSILLESSSILLDSIASRNEECHPTKVEKRNCLEECHPTKMEKSEEDELFRRVGQFFSYYMQHTKYKPI